MNRKKIAKIIFSRVLQLSVEKYLSYIVKVAKAVINSVEAGKSTQAKLVYARVIREGRKLSFDILDSRLAKEESGIYELSVPFKISYCKNRSNIVYIGFSKNLRKRIASYSSSRVKNSRLAGFINNHEVFVRFCYDERYVGLEKRLLYNFKTNYGELPKANILGVDL